MRAAGEQLTSAVRIGQTSRDVSLRQPADPTAQWTWTAVMRELRKVQVDPVTAIEQGLAFEDDEANVTTANVGRLILESDMPGGPNSVAGPPPAGTVFDAPPLPSLVHDATWFRAVRGSRVPRSSARPPRRAVRAGCGADVNEQLRGLSREEALAAAPPIEPLTSLERDSIIAMFTDLLDGLYVHLPLKRAMYGIDPVQQLRRLNERARVMSDDAFHREIATIMSNLRDAHTVYIAPSPFLGSVARLPFLVEQFGSEAAPGFMVSKVIPELVDDPEFVKGVEVLEWNGVPIADAVRRRGEVERGGRPDSAMARALDSLTLRPLGLGPPPDEKWVIVGYRTGDDAAAPGASVRVAVHRPRPGARRTAPHRTGRDGDRDASRPRPRATGQEAVVQHRAVDDRGLRPDVRARRIPRHERLDDGQVPGQRLGPLDHRRRSRLRLPATVELRSLRRRRVRRRSDQHAGPTAAGRADHRPAWEPGRVDLGRRAVAAAVHPVADLTVTVLDHRVRPDAGDDRRPAEPARVGAVATHPARGDRHRRGLLAVGHDHPVRALQRHRPGVRRSGRRRRRSDHVLGGRPVRRRVRRQRPRHRRQCRAGDRCRRRQRVAGRHAQQRVGRDVASACPGCPTASASRCRCAVPPGSARRMAPRSKTSASSVTARTR